MEEVGGKEYVGGGIPPYLGRRKKKFGGVIFFKLTLYNETFIISNIIIVISFLC